MTIALREGGLDDPRVAALLTQHLVDSHAETPADNAHALGLEGLRDPAIRFWCAWESEALLGFGALKRLSADAGEIKSMRTADAARRRGVARALLSHLVALARTEGLARIHLETGTAPSFAAANRLYEGFGFVDGPVFGGYPASPHNRFMVLEL